MQPPVTVVAEMADGSAIVEHVADFAAFIAVVLPFRRDPECLRVTWHPTPALALRELQGQRPMLAEVA